MLLVFLAKEVIHFRDNFLALTFKLLQYLGYLSTLQLEIYSRCRDIMNSSKDIQTLTLALVYNKNALITTI